MTATSAHLRSHIGKIGLDAKGNVLPTFSCVNGAFWPDEPPLVEDDFVRALAGTRPMRRLRRIGFLGAIDYIKKQTGSAPHKRRHNRLEHSLGVGLLAELYARSSPAEVIDRRLLLAAALLHDVGHGPLSHTLEPVFDAEFGINHHQATELIVRGQTRLGLEVAAALRNYSVDAVEVVSLINGRHSGPMNFLFSGQINLDTLEGITRSRAFLSKATAPASAGSMASKIARLDCLPTAELDDFWKTKHQVYNLFIHANRGLVLDSIAQAYMRDNLRLFKLDDFFATEQSLKNRHPYLFQLFEAASQSPSALAPLIPSSWLDARMRVKKRAFHIDPSVDLDSLSAMNARYFQTKSYRYVSLRELLDSR